MPGCGRGLGRHMPFCEEAHPGCRIGLNDLFGS